MNDFHFAVVVGIDIYPGIRNLNSARADAQAFAAWLRDVNGGALPKNNVQIILEEGPFDDPVKAQPTRDAVNLAFSRVHKRARAIFQEDPTKWPASRLYVYFSGHGLAPEPSEVAVLMANATDDEPYNIACGLYLEYYEKCQDFHEIVMFSDCCRAAKTDAPPGAPPFMPYIKNYGSVVSALGYATQYKGLAYEPPPGENARGYYTQALLDGLNGEAVDPESPGEINSTSLQNYLRARVPALSQGKRVPQVPAMKADPAARIVFREGAKRAMHRITMVFPPQFHGRVILLDGRFTKIDTHDVNGVPWEKPLSDGLYEVRQENPIPEVTFKAEGLFRVLGGDANVKF